MNSKRVIDYKHLPATFPIFNSLTTFLVLERFNAPGWVWGAVGVIGGAIWISCIVKFSTQKEVEF